jgi:hypothetical protein
MARTISDIQKEILQAKQKSANLSALEVLTDSEQNILQANSNSKVGIWRLWVWIFSYAHFILEQYWAIFKTEIETRIAQSRIHTPKWYREKALNFLYGIPLVQDKDYYDTSLLTAQQIADAKIVSNAASVRVVQSGYGTLRMKVVRTVNGEYAPVLPAHLIALNTYFNSHIADAGTLVTVTTGNADLLKLKLDIYYDPLILGADGSRLDGTDATPVIRKISDYLKSIDFENGSLILTYLTDNLQKVPGVKLPVVKEAFSKYGAYGYNTTGVQNVGVINEIRVADSGYMKLDLTELLINYIPYSE